MTYCPRCGKSVPAGASFCPTCGFALGSTPIPPAPREVNAWPVVRIIGVPVVASAGRSIDLRSVAQVLQRDKPIPKGKDISEVIFRLKHPPTQTVIHSSGKIEVYASVLQLAGGKSLRFHTKSEVQAREALEEVTKLLNQAKIPIRGGLVAEVGPVSAAMYLGRGIEIGSLPERVPNSLYAQRLESRDPSGSGSIQGRYNRAGVLVQLTSEEQLGKAIGEISGGRFSSRRTMSLPHISYCRLRESPVVAQMVRSLDKDGNMLLTGYAHLEGARSEAEARASASNFGTILEQAGLLTALTPRDRIGEEVMEQDPGAFDYFANNPEI